MPPSPSPSDAEVRTLAEQVLGRPEYAMWHSKTSIPEVLRWLFELLARSPQLYWSIVAGLTLLLVLIVWHVVWTIRRSLAQGSPDTDGRPAANDPRFLDEAYALAERGCFLDAARTMHLAVIQLLVRAGRVQLGRADPNTVLRRRLRDARLGEAARDEIVALLDRLERSWFRDHRDDRSLYDGWHALYVRLGMEIQHP